ncbi:MAG: UDP-N-acetylglucosamine 2-epimerase (non-hydrolyzing) [Candidatus Marinimicrobia bacterium]|nr:UDP-N-acetylglucosamine 2-epimerase (non-hydrolyzing) [Candidatus Neomarinimicrobiota bacterium]
MKVDLIAGARPNFIKIAAIIDAIKEFGENKIKFRLIHTGQHYDKNMSDSFFQQLGIPKPDYNLEAGGGTQAEQTAKIMVGYESLLKKKKMDLCLVVGDVTSTMACSIVAKKMGLKVAHVEAGIRSGDLMMPEEINRIVTDSISDYFFTTSETANNNLIKYGVDTSKIFFVGNTMIDTLVKYKNNLIKPSIWDELGLIKKNYLVMTLHRPSNVEEVSNLRNYINEIVINSNNIPIIFPTHPRTSKKLNLIDLSFSNLHLIKPLSYLEFNFLIEKSKAVITDSGGITEEATFMNVPCMTLRDNTERPETVELGTNELLGTNPKAIFPALNKLFLNQWKKGTNPPLWDGKTSRRIINHLLHL